MLHVHRQFKGHIFLIYTSHVTYEKIVFDHNNNIPYVMALLSMRMSEASYLVGARALKESIGLEPENPIDIISRRDPTKNFVGIIQMLLKAESTFEYWILANVQCHQVASLLLHYFAKVHYTYLVIAGVNNRDAIFNLYNTFSWCDLRDETAYPTYNWKPRYNAQINSFLRRNECLRFNCFNKSKVK